MAWKSFALPSLPQQGKKSHVPTAVALGSFCRFQEGPDTCRLVPQQMSRLRCGTDPLGQGELPAPSSGDELLRTTKGRAGDDTTALRVSPAGDYFSDSDLCFPAGPARPAVPEHQAPHGTRRAGTPRYEADGSGPCSAPAKRGLAPRCTFRPGARIAFRCPAGSSLARPDCEHPAASGPPQSPVPGRPRCSAQGRAPAAPLSISRSPRRFGSQRLPSAPGTGPQHEQDETPAGAFDALLSHPNSSPPKRRVNPLSLKMQTTSKLSSGTETLLRAIPLHYT